MIARIDIMRALKRHVEREFDPSRKDANWGKWCGIIETPSLLAMFAIRFFG
jgi:hypothetical protein